VAFPDRVETRVLASPCQPENLTIEKPNAPSSPAGSSGFLGDAMNVGSADPVTIGARLTTELMT